MSELNSRLPALFLFAACVTLISFAGELQPEAVWIRPDRLREGDGKARNITVEAVVDPGAQLSISVSYSSDPHTAGTNFISKFNVQDNSAEDRNAEQGKIHLVLPKAFDKTGVYLIAVDKPPGFIKLVHEPNNSSYFRQFVDWLVTAAGSGQRGKESKTARDRIVEVTNNKTQDSFAIWTAPLPQVGKEIDPKSLKVKIPSAVMPSWSPNGNYLACSAWRNGKWVMAVYTINRTGALSQSWQWKPREAGTTDFSPAWSPRGDAVAFVRLTPDMKSDIWILQLDRNRRPKKEIKVTDLGNVHAVLGWDKDIGLLFETRGQVEQGSILRQVWATNATVAGTRADTVALSDAYDTIKGSAPRRRTVIYIQQNDSPPYSELREIDSSRKQWTLLPGDFCSRRWLAVSQDEKWLAFEYDCPD